MSSRPNRFAASDEDILALVDANPFAWVVTAVPGFRATPLPLRPVLDPQGGLTGFLGHFARRNPQVEEIAAAGRALLLFLGAHGYVSASWITDRTQAPTWNYMAAGFDCAITMIDDEEGVADCLAVLVEAMERGRPKAWSMAEMGERAARLARGVIGFRADIISREATFKLGQDERDDVLADVLAALESGAVERPEPGRALAAQMRRHNAGRLASMA